MDNFIMITAGSAIDQTLGVQLGLATMTAAAIGQVVSDVSGVLFGDTLANWFNVAPANLSKAQSQFKVVNRIKLGGAVAGMVVGCTLGAVALWIIPEKDEGASQTDTLSAQQLLHERKTDQLCRIQQVMYDMMTSQDEAWHDLRASCTLYVDESLEDSIPSNNRRESSFFESRRGERTASIRALANTTDPQVKHTLKEGRVVVFTNTIYVPVVGAEEDAIVGIFKIKLDNGSFFPPGSDIKNAKAIARTIGFFLNRML